MSEKVLEKEKKTYENTSEKTSFLQFERTSPSKKIEKKRKRVVGQVPSLSKRSSL